jgi:hypothetical protein
MLNFIMDAKSQIEIHSEWVIQNVPLPGYIDQLNGHGNGVFG